MNPKNQIKLAVSFKIVLFLSLVYFPIFLHLDSLPIRVWDEARLAISAHEMLHNNNYLIPHYNGQPDMWGTKPPLVIWLQTFFYKCIGVSELAVRLPSALAAFFTTLIIMLFSIKYLKNYWFGLIASLVLVTSYGYINGHAVRTGDLDSPVAFFTTFYCLTFFLFIELGDRKYLHLFFIGLTLSVLAKSVQGLLFIPALGIYVLMAKKFWEIAKNKWFYFDLLICIAVVLSYYLTREYYNPGYLKAVSENELGGRYLTSLEGHENIFMFYFNQLLDSNFSDWILFVPCGLLVGFTLKDAKLKRLTLFSFLAILSYWLVISISQTKCEWYDVPLYPLMSIVCSIAIYWAFLSLREATAVNPILKFYIIPALFLVIVFIRPYQKIIDKVYFPKESSREIDETHISYFLKEAVHSKRSIKDYTICYNGHNAHLAFYLIPLNEKNQNVHFKDWHLLAPEDIASASQYDVQQYIEKHYLFEIVDTYFNVKTYKIKSTATEINDSQKDLELKKIICLKAFNGKYICVSPSSDQVVLASSDKASKLTLIEKNSCKIAVDSLFFCTELGKQNQITASRKIAREWETFTRIELDSNFVAFKAVNGKYLSVDPRSLKLSANSDSIGNQEKFKISIDTTKK